MAIEMRAGLAAIAMAIAMTAAAAAAIVIGGSAAAATVSGTLTSAGGAPQQGREVHFEERLTNDIFVAVTGPSGTFSADLPEGVYDLRTETGPIIDGGIAVGASAVALGKVQDVAGDDLTRFFQTQEVGEAIVKSEAPSTADVPSKDDAVTVGVTPTIPAPSAAVTLAPSPAVAN